MEKAELIEFLKQKMDEHWRTRQSPYLLSEIPADLESHKGVSYKEILGEQRLKNFTSETSHEGGYKLVQHPTQSAKLGLVPYDSEFSFTPDNEPLVGVTERLSEDKKTNRSKLKYATITFLEAVSKLPESDQKEIQIPTRIIAQFIS